MKDLQPIQEVIINSMAEKIYLPEPSQRREKGEDVQP